MRPYDGTPAHQHALASEYWVEGRQLFTNAFGTGAADDGDSLTLRGANWHGFESRECSYSGSWTRTPLAAILQTLRQAGFNAVRLPFAHQSVLDNSPVTSAHFDPRLNPQLLDARSRDGTCRAASCRAA